MIIGTVAGALSTIGFRFIKPVLQKFRAHDTCGVNNLHGMPGLLAGIFGIILAIYPTYSLHTDNLLDTCWHGHNRSYLLQVGYQAAALGATIGIAIVVWQIALGGWTSANYASLVCTELPICEGDWVAKLDCAGAFTVPAEENYEFGVHSHEYS